ncbi:MAG: hypothetical protein ACR2MQ_13565 [Gemmatimonadaceae bacterium]
MLLSLHDGVIVLDSPRSATILLIAGSVPAALHDAVQHVHDEMTQPRTTVWWTRDTISDPADENVSHGAQYNDRYNVSSPDVVSLVDALKRVQNDLISGVRQSEPDELSSTSLFPWRGVGPYGHGGTGMTGGTPYGRPMAERAVDRDGLQLDQLPLRIGPYFNAFPAGLVLDIELQGDVVQDVVVSGEPVSPLLPVFAGAINDPISVAVLECARAEDHLRWLAHALRVHGLAALSSRALQLSMQIGAGDSAIKGSRAELKAITRDVERSGALWWSTRGVGLLSRDAVADQGLGPIARASGVIDDARIDEPAYQALGFELIVNTAVNTASSDKDGGDASARWRQLLAEAAQSLDLAAKANGARAWGHGVVEGPRGRVTAGEAPEPQLYAMLPDLLRGMEWGDAVTTIVSLNLGAGGDVRSVQPWTAAEKAVQSAEEAMEKGKNGSASDMSGMAGMAHMGH